MFQLKQSTCSIYLLDFNLFKLYICIVNCFTYLAFPLEWFLNISNSCVLYVGSSEIIH